MPRLPGIQYTQGVESLGRRDMEGPMQLARAKTAYLDKLPGVVEAFEFADDSSLTAEQVAIFRKAFKMTKAEMLEANMIDISQYGDLPLKYNEEDVVRRKTGEKLVPAWQVLEDVFNHKIKQLTKDTFGKLKTKEQQAAFNTATSDMVANGFMDIRKENIILRDKELEGRFLVAFKEAKEEGNGPLAKAHLNAAKKTGVIDAIQYAKHLDGLDAIIEENQSLFRLNSEDPDDLRQLADDMRTNLYQNEYGIWTAYNMSPKRRHAIADSAEKKLKKIEDQRIKAKKAEDEQRSNDQMKNLLVEMGKSGEPMLDSQLDEAADMLNRSDFLTVAAVDRAYRKEFRTKLEKSDPAAVDFINGKITAQLLDGPLTAQEYRRQAREAVREALGQTKDGSFVAAPTITASFANDALARIDAAYRAPLNRPEVKRGEELIYNLLTGGSKDEDGEWGRQGMGSAAVNLTMAVDQYLADMLTQGADADPNAWIKENMPRFATQQMNMNVRTLIKNALGDYIIKGKVKGTMDAAKTADRLTEAFENKKITEDQLHLGLRVVRWTSALPDPDVPILITTDTLAKMQQHPPTE